MLQVKGASASVEVFPVGSSAMARRIREHDWAATSLGPTARWPQSLRSAVDIMLALPGPVSILWGSERVQLYNDAYVPIAGAHHPDALGRPASETWAEVYDSFLGPTLDRAFAGEAVTVENAALVFRGIDRDGPKERVFSASFSPVRDEAGAVAGVFHPIVEITKAVLAERHRAFLLRLSDAKRHLSDTLAILAVTDELLAHELSAVRVGYAEVHQDGDSLVGLHEHRSERLSVTDGLERISSYGAVLARDLAAGRTVVVADVVNDLRMAGAAAAHVARGTRAFLAVPIMRDSRLHATLHVDADMPRVWTDAEVELVREVAERTWNTVERARSERALRENEEHYRFTVELSPQVTWTAGPDGLLDRVAERWGDWTGTSGHADSWVMGLHPDDLADTAKAWSRSVATGEPYDIEHRIRTRSGDYRWVRSRAFPRRDDEGRVIRWYGTSEDVEERKRAEAALLEAVALSRAQAEELTAVLDAVPAGIWISRDARAREIVGNVRAHEMLRVSLGQNLSKTHPEAPTRHFRFLEPDGSETPLADLPVQRAARGEPLTQREYRVAFGDGTHIDLFGNATPLHDAQGHAVGSVAAFVDITERKAMEGQLREETRILEMISQAGSALAAELDLERLIQSLTDAGVALTGAQFGAFFHNVTDHESGTLQLYTLSGARRSDFDWMGGVRPTGVFGPTFQSKRVVRSDDITRDPRYGQLEPHRGMPKGHLPVRSYLGLPVVSRAGEVLGGLFFGHPEPGRFVERHERVMTGLASQAAVAIDNARLFQAVQRANETLESRVAERTAELARAQDALQQSQKMEAVGQLTGGIAHDFNNLLQGVCGSLDLIRRKAHDVERVRRFAEAGLQAAERGAKLTAQLLAFSRAQRIELKPLIVSDLVGSMQDLLQRSLGPMVRLRLDLTHRETPVLSDPTQLEMAVLNLTINARDAMPDGGELTIATQILNIDKDVELSPGDYVELSVADIGTGMPPEVAARAFDPFFTTKGIGKGTGLGLSQVYGVAKQTRGVARIESLPGVGTTVRLLLPWTDALVRPEVESEAVSPAPASLSATVLIVDDDADVRRVLADMLDTLGYAVREAADGPAGLALLTAARPDLLIVDFAMPGMNGAEVARAARERRPDLPVVFASGYADTAAIEDVAGTQAVMLRKPFRVDELQAVLTTALRS